MNTVPGGAVPRSSFVTSLAWVFIVLAGFATVTSVLGVVQTWDAAGRIHGALSETHGSQAVPVLPFDRFMFEHFRFFSVAFLLVWALTFVSAIGLLKRKNWARLIFISLLGLGVVQCLAGIFVAYHRASSYPSIPDTTPMIAFTTIFGIGFAVLFAWLAKRLVSADVKREFSAL